MNISKEDLITSGCIEVITKEELKRVLEENSHPKSYWGVAPTGPPHIGYYRAIAKQIDLINAGCKHFLLIADIHAYLDDRKANWNDAIIKGKAYEVCFKKLGLDKAKYVYGRELQTSEEYILLVYRLSGLVTVKRARRAASEVVRRKENPHVSEIIYPIMQIIDAAILDVDISYGGIDQRHIYMLGREVLPSVGRKKYVAIFTPLGLGLSGKGKMSASKEKDRLELFAPPERIRAVINKAFCPEKVIDGNPIVEYLRYLIFPRVSKFIIEREAKYGGDIEFENYEEFEKEYVKGNIHPADLKKAVARYLIKILKPIREYFDKHEELKNVFGVKY